MKIERRIRKTENNAEKHVGELLGRSSENVTEFNNLLLRKEDDKLMQLRLILNANLNDKRAKADYDDYFSILKVKYSSDELEKINYKKAHLNTFKKGHVIETFTGHRYRLLSNIKHEIGGLVITEGIDDKGKKKFIALYHPYNIGNEWVKKMKRPDVKYIEEFASEKNKYPLDLKDTYKQKHTTGDWTKK